MTSPIRVADEPGVVLHTRPYRETSLIVSVLTLNYGRVSLVGRGVRGRRGRPIQPFCTARIGWSGRAGLGTLTGYETERQFWFGGRSLASAFYLAEIVTRLLAEREAHPRVYAAFAWALENLDGNTSAVLRSFEKLLLEELGYGLDFERDMQGRPLAADGWYRLVPDQGFEAAESGYAGRLLRAIGGEAFQDRDVRQAARRLFAEALSVHLGPRPLLSRRLLLRGG
ncbi:MAG TPA: DNA repair protein RecO [Pseudomonadales bacterium]